MTDYTINRRSFLKLLGWGGAGTALAGCDMPTTVTLEEGKEPAVSYLMPEEYVIPGVGIWYASTCTQCPARCGLHGRVREGRVLKLEGNPDSPINAGKTCSMGQAGLQAHYNPDRITQPLLRRSGKLEPATWDEAMAALKEHVGADANADDRAAWFTGTVSGHQAVLIAEHLDALKSRNHFVHEAVNASVWSAVSRDMLGDAMPRLRLDHAKAVLSFGADFLGTWISPVQFSGQYAKFRGGDRGVLIQVEPKMTLTGGSADLWLAARPGTEGALALGIANVLVNRNWTTVSVPQAAAATISGYTPEKVAVVTGISADKIQRIAEVLHERSPSLVLAGDSVAGHQHGYNAVAAVMLLNVLLGNVGKTIQPAERFPEERMRAKAGDSASLIAFTEAVKAKKFDVVFFYDTNPVFTAPAALGLKEALANVPFKVALARFPDETAMAADLVLPVYSAIEDWGTHVPAYQSGDQATMGFQQPLMEPLYKDTRGFGDVVLAMVQMRNAQARNYADYYAYLKASIDNMPASMKGDGANWQLLLQKGVLKSKGATVSLTMHAQASAQAEYQDDNPYPFHLIPSASPTLWDGRHANLPWLQEAPDPISKVVWESWAEMHPKTAAALGVKTGDFVTITSAQGSIEAQVYVFKGVHPNAVAVPMGQGHDEYGRYAKGRGVNPLQILDPIKEAKTGELATHATRVKIAKTNKHLALVKMGGSETQHGRKIVATVSADVLRRTEGGV